MAILLGILKWVLLLKLVIFLMDGQQNMIILQLLDPIMMDIILLILIEVLLLMEVPQ